MLGYRHAACRCNECRRSRDIERADLVSARADNIHDRALRLDVRTLLTHDLGACCDLGDGLALHAHAVRRVAISISVAVPSIISSTRCAGDGVVQIAPVDSSWIASCIMIYQPFCFRCYTFRKFFIMTVPCGVRMDSGWNFTP